MARSRSGEYAVVGCLFSPAVVLFGLAIFLPSDPRHGNGLIVALAVLVSLAAGFILLLQAALPKPPSPSDGAGDHRDRVA